MEGRLGSAAWGVVGPLVVLFLPVMSSPPTPSCHPMLNDVTLGPIPPSAPGLTGPGLSPLNQGHFDPKIPLPVPLEKAGVRDKGGGVHLQFQAC